MTVQELIDILQGEVKPPDRKNAQIEIWEDNQEYEIESMSGFSISPDIVISIKKTTTPMMKHAVVKQEHKSKVRAAINKIRKGAKDETGRS